MRISEGMLRFSLIVQLSSDVLNREKGMRRGKSELSVDECEAVVRLKEHFDQERKSMQAVPTRDSFGRTAAALGIIGVAKISK